MLECNRKKDMFMWETGKMLAGESDWCGVKKDD